MSLSIPAYDSAQVLVAGDAMLDRYWFGPVERISPEAPVPVVRVDGIEERPGGAGNVAVNLAALGMQTTLVCATGEDEAAGRLDTLLDARGIRCRFARTPGVPTVTKLRVLSRNQQLIRLDFEDTRAGGDEVSIAAPFREELAAKPLVVLSDYAKGSLREAPALIAAAREAGVDVLVDPKGADFARYRGAAGITPNLGEFEAVAGRCDSDAVMIERGQRMRADLDLGFLLITRSERGMLLIDESGALSLPAEAREVYDVTGAGDTVIAVLAAGLAVGERLADAAAVANLAAGIVVGKLGVASVSRGELRLALHQRGVGGRGLLTREQVCEFASESQARGERVVMTNGCFDILHAGHVAYLEDAKALGDRLLVAVNDDASVTRLKGRGRPVNPLADRLAVLTGLAAVDWVVPFGEDTPAALIAAVRPDVLVKGGDYRVEQIAGADTVLAAGGQVRVLQFRPGRSTSAIIEAIRADGQK